MGSSPEVPLRLCASVADSLPRLLGLQVCFHDYSGGAVAEVLGVRRLNHTNAFCSAVKPRSERGENTCTRCDVAMVQARLATGGGSFVKQCHAGVCELVFPLRAGAQLVGALFVGPFRWPAQIQLPDHSLIQRATDRRNKRAAQEFERVPVLAAERLGDIRLVCDLLVAQVSRSLVERATAGAGAGYAVRIRTFISGHSASAIRVHDLAQALFCSDSYASQLVRKHFKTTFRGLLTKHRLAHARQLLEGSHLTIAAIARTVGFDDPTYFHRVFHKAAGEAPLAYRRRVWRDGVAGGV